MPTDAEMIAKFLAEKGATKVEAGARALTPAQKRSLNGWEPDVVVKVEPLEEGARISGYDHLNRAIYVNEEGEYIARGL